MADAAALVKALKADRSWDAVALLCAEHGEPHDGAYWRKVGLSRFTPNWRALDALRQAAGLPALGPSPAETVRMSGVGHVVAVCDDPDLALLVRTGGAAPQSISIRVDGTGVAELTEPPSIRVTQVTSRSERVGDRDKAPLSIWDIPPVDRRRLGRGKSGFHPAIEAAARRAAEEA